MESIVPGGLGPGPPTSTPSLLTVPLHLWLSCAAAPREVHIIERLTHFPLPREHSGKSSIKLDIPNSSEPIPVYSPCNWVWTGWLSWLQSYPLGFQLWDRRLKFQVLLSQVLSALCCLSEAIVLVIHSSHSEVLCGDYRIFQAWLSGFKGKAFPHSTKSIFTN